jgi:hypothetical protein
MTPLPFSRERLAIRTDGGSNPHLLGDATQNE